jgi:hypothetical protein
MARICEGAQAGCGTDRTQGIKKSGEPKLPNYASTITLSTSSAHSEVNQSLRAFYGELGCISKSLR